jgi:hypothetical protein
MSSDQTDNSPSKHEEGVEMESSMIQRDTFEESIQKMQQGISEYKPSTFALYLDANGYQMVELVTEEENGSVKVRTQTDKFFMCPKTSLKILQPEVVQLIKGETDLSTKDDEIEKKNLEYQLSPTADISEELTCCQKFMNCCSPPRDDLRSNKFRRTVRRSINFLNLSARKKAILLDRYVSLVENYEKTRKRYTIAYNSTRSMVTLLNILTPAFVSIQPMWGGEAYTNGMYWTTFATTIVSGLITSYIGLFKLDKKFYSTTQAYLRLETEGWCYFTLTGKYGKDPDNPTFHPTHENRFFRFCAEVEGIRRSEMKVDMVKPPNMSTTSSSACTNSQEGTRRK